LHKFHSPISVTDINGQIKEFELPKYRDGKFNYFKSAAFTYQAEAVRKCIEKGLLEHPSVTHEESLLIAKIEDEIRRQVGVKYPEDE
jgi:dihydrodiol dehydrogenase / D-xylose 1-dehydrogenase (NADP)